MKKFIISTAAVLAFSLSSAPAALAGENVLYNMTVKGMFCQSCAARTKNVLKKIDGVKTVEVDVAKGNVAVCATPVTRFTDVQLKEIFLSKGFSYKGNKQAGTC